MIPDTDIELSVVLYFDAGDPYPTEEELVAMLRCVVVAYDVEEV